MLPITSYESWSSLDRKRTPRSVRPQLAVFDSSVQIRRHLRIVFLLTTSPITTASALFAQLDKLSSCSSLRVDSASPTSFQIAEVHAEKVSETASLPLSEKMCSAVRSLSLIVKWLWSIAIICDKLHRLSIDEELNRKTPKSTSILIDLTLRPTSCSQGRLKPLCLFAPASVLYEHVFNWVSLNLRCYCAVVSER